MKEVIERNEKQIAALPERIQSGDRRKLQKEMEQQHQILQSRKDKLASIMREMHAKHRRLCGRKCGLYTRGHHFGVVWHPPTLSWVPPDTSPAWQATERASRAYV